MSRQICLDTKEVFIIEKSKLTEEVHVKFNKRVYLALKKCSKNTGASISWIIRHCTQAFLSKKGYLIEE